MEIYKGQQLILKENTGELSVVRVSKTTLTYYQLEGYPTTYFNYINMSNCGRYELLETTHELLAQVQLQKDRKKYETHLKSLDLSSVPIIDLKKAWAVMKPKLPSKTPLGSFLEEEGLSLSTTQLHDDSIGITIKYCELKKGNFLHGFLGGGFTHHIALGNLTEIISNTTLVYKAYDKRERRLISVPDLIGE